MVERRFVFDAVDRALAFLDKLGGLDLGTYRKLPVGPGLALTDDCVREVALADDLAGDLEMAVLDLRRDDSHAPERVVLVVCEKRHSLRHGHPRHVHHDGARPAEEAHLAAGVGDALDGRLPARCGGGYFEVFSLHRLPFPVRRARPPRPSARVRP